MLVAAALYGLSLFLKNIGIAYVAIVAENISVVLLYVDIGLFCVTIGVFIIIFIIDLYRLLYRHIKGDRVEEELE